MLRPLSQHLGSVWGWLTPENKDWQKSPFQTLCHGVFMQLHAFLILFLLANPPGFSSIFVRIFHEKIMGFSMEKNHPAIGATPIIRKPPTDPDPVHWLHRAGRASGSELAEVALSTECTHIHIIYNILHST